MNYPIKRADSSINSSDSLQSNTSMISFLLPAHAAAEASISAAGSMETPQFKHTSRALWKAALQAPILYLPTPLQTNSFFNFLILSVLCFHRSTSCNESLRVSLQLEQHKHEKASQSNWENLFSHSSAMA